MVLPMHLCVGDCANTATLQSRASQVGKASLQRSAAAFIHSLGQLQPLRLCKSSSLAHRAQRAWPRSKWHRAFHHPRGGGIRTRSVRFAVQISQRHLFPKDCLRVQRKRANIFCVGTILSLNWRPEVLEQRKVHADGNHVLHNISQPCGLPSPL